MQFSKIALSVALAVGAVSANAAAPGIPGTGVTVIYVSGASGTDSFLGSIASNLLTVSKYIKSASASDYQAWYGTAKAGAISNVATGTQILFIKRSKGGSAFGIGPLARQQKLAVVDYTSASCTLDSTVSGVENYTCPVVGTDFDNASAGLVPDFGVSDVEPAMFGGINTEFGQTALTAAELSTLVAKPWAQLAEGVAVTMAVPTSTVITRTGLRNLMTKASSDWSYVDGTTDPLVVCRRAPGSGTQSAFNWYNTNFPCTSAYNGYGSTIVAKSSDSLGLNTSTAGTSLDPYLVDPTQGYAVIENNSSGDVRACLSNAQTHTDFTHTLANGKVEKVQFSLSSTPMKAIGVLSADSYNKTGAAAANGYKTNWYFHNIDGAGAFDVTNQVASMDATGATVTAGSSGIAPSRDNIISGAYDFVVEPTMQYKTGSAAVGNATKLNFFNTLQSKLGDPTNMSNVVSSSINPVPYAYSALPQLYASTNTPATFPVSVNSREGNTCSLMHPAF